MIKLLVGMVGLGVALASAPVWADDVTPKRTGNAYYLGGSLGYTDVSYHANPTLQAFSDSQSPGTSFHLPYTVDLVFLIAMGDEQTALGFGYNGILDAYFPKDTYDYSNIHQSNLVLTARHFFGDAIGHGFFVRGDVGWCIVGSSSDTYDPSASNPSSSGFTWLAGGGYGIPLSPHVSLDAELDYGRVKLPDGALGNFQVKAGVLVGL